MVTKTLPVAPAGNHRRRRLGSPHGCLPSRSPNPPAADPRRHCRGAGAGGKGGRTGGHRRHLFAGRRHRHRPAAVALPSRHGGFGGEAGLERWLRDDGTDTVIDATHAFARAMPGRAAALCDRLGLRYLRLLRPGWAERPGERWHWIDRPEQAAAAIPPGAAVLLATGSRSLGDFAALDRPAGACPRHRRGGAVPVHRRRLGRGPAALRAGG